MRCVLLSDLHVSRRPGARDNRALARIVAHLRRAYPVDARPQVILSGDVTNNGSEAEFEAALELLAPLRDAGFPIVACPGNHDVGPLGNSFAASSRVYFQQYVVGELMGVAAAKTASDVMDDLYPLVTPVDGGLLIGLDSAHQEDFLAAGRIGEAQLAKLRERLSERAPGTTTLVYVHHHPFLWGPQMAMIDADRLMEVLRDQVDVLCFGHKHSWGRWTDRDGIRLILASGKATKRERRPRRYEYWEVTVQTGSVSWSRRKVSPRGPC
ncbi:MAG: metallophosphoesterase [Myxococcales bacterium]|nr:metallophosphoesterase [Myxococcales bacterium]